MIISSSKLDTFDRCERRFAFERDWDTLALSPLGLLYHAVEASLTAPEPLQGLRDAISDITSRVDITSTEISPISAIRHVELIGEVIALALRDQFGAATRPDRQLIDTHIWEPGLFNFRGVAHRLILTSHIDDDTLRSYAQSWQTIGELAMIERPITLLVITVGYKRKGRFNSHWAKGWQHPIQKNALRFAPRKKEEEFTSGWSKLWREHTTVEAHQWLDRMRSDGVLEDLIQTWKVQYNPTDHRLIQAKQDIFNIVEMMEGSSPQSPMRRSSCNEIGRGACPFQAVCYSPTPLSPADLPHLYHERETPLVTLRG